MNAFLANLYLRATALRDEKGQAMAEYGIILALIAVVCVVAVGLLGIKSTAPSTSSTASSRSTRDGSGSSPRGPTARPHHSSQRTEDQVRNTNVR